MSERDCLYLFSVVMSMTATSIKNAEYRKNQMGSEVLPGTLFYVKVLIIRTSKVFLI